MSDTRQKEVKELMDSLSEALKAYDNIDYHKPVKPIDAFFAFRILLGRNPNLEEELPRLLAVAKTKELYRDYLSNLTGSAEFSKQSMFVPAGRTWMAQLEDFKFWFNTSDKEMGVRMAMNVYEPEGVSLVKKLVKKGMKCIDAGANTGFYSCVIASIVGERGRVFAFEPMPANFNMLQRNIKENSFDRIVKSYNMACSDSEKTLDGVMVSNMYVIGDVGAGEKVRIRSVKADDVLAKENEKIDFIKIDVEGHEPAAIRGMTEIIRKGRPVILSEINEYWLRHCSASSGKEYLDQLMSLGYKVYEVNEPDKQLTPDGLDLGALDNISIIALPARK